METLPPKAPSDVPVLHTEASLDDFRVSSPAEITVMLRELAAKNTTLNLAAPDGSAVGATVWAMDPGRGSISLKLDPDDPLVTLLVEADEVSAVAFLDNVKLQFDLQGLVLVHGANGTALNCAFPRELFRFQRRNAFRVRPVLPASPVARMRHPVIPEMQLALRILDVSLGGCALFMPDDVPQLPAGVLLNGVQLELDADTRLQVALRLQHVTAINPESRGVRIGCELLNANSESLRSLQRYIDQTQKKRRLMVLE